MPDAVTMMPDPGGKVTIDQGYGGGISDDTLAARVQRDYGSASTAKTYQEQKVFVRAMFNCKNYYDPSRASFVSTTSQAFVNATRPKVQTATALMVPIVCPPGQPPFTIDPDPEAIDPEAAMKLLQQGVSPGEIRDQMYQEGGKKADRLTAKIKKGLDFTKFNDKAVRLLIDFTMFGTAIILGPQAQANPEIEGAPQTDESAWDSIIAFFGNKKEKPHKYQPLIDLGLLDRYLPVIDIVSPLDFYPDPSAYSIEQSRFAIWRMTLSKAQLIEMANLPGFRNKDVQQVLEDNPTGNWQPAFWESAINALNNQPMQNVPGDRFTCYQWWGFLTGKDLREAGVPDIPASRNSERVLANIWTVGGRTVKAAISELHKERLPFLVAPYSVQPNCIWGIGIPEMMFDSQDAINALERALIDNMAICHAPQLAVDLNQLSNPSSVLEITTKKIWAIESKPGVTAKPVEYFYPPCLIQELLAAIEHEKGLAQEQTGIPNFLSGLNNGSETHNRTFGGFSLQFQNALTTLKAAAYNLENNIISPLIQKMIRFNQLYSNDPLCKGSFQVTAHGVRGLMAREAFMEAMNGLFQNLQNMPDQLKRIKWSNAFNSYFRNSGLANDDLVFSDEEFARNQQAEQEAEQKNAAYMAGVQASVQSTPKQRAETPLRDALLDLVKAAPEGSDLALRYMDMINKSYQIDTPEMQQAIQEAMALNHLGALNQAHAAGHEMSTRNHEAKIAMQPPPGEEEGGAE